MGIYMKKNILVKIFLTLVVLTLISCRDPIFYNIAQEEKQLDPLIKGSPSNFVNFNGRMYVVSGTTLYRYNGTYSGNPARGDWTSSTPGGNIRQLAATSTAMYALCGDAGRNILKAYNGSGWSNVPVPPEISVQSIYAVNDQLFIGAGSYGAYSIFDSDYNKLLDTQNRLLNGTAWDGANYYLIAKDFDTPNGSTYGITGVTSYTINNSIPFMGIINLGNAIAAISRDGILYYVKSSGISSTGHRLRGNNRDKLATGALAIWTDPATSGKLLLVGRNDEKINSVNYLYGYQELELASGEIMSGAAFRDPGLHSLTTVDNNATYKSNMEKNPVNSLFQADDGILFASTQNKGVWSYRFRVDKWLWNAEQ
jgi:hypothetical protein